MCCVPIINCESAFKIRYLYACLSRVYLESAISSAVTKELSQGYLKLLETESSSVTKEGAHRKVLSESAFFLKSGAHRTMLSEEMTGGHLIPIVIPFPESKAEKYRAGVGGAHPYSSRPGSESIPSGSLGGCSFEGSATPSEWVTP